MKQSFAIPINQKKIINWKREFEYKKYNYRK